MDRCPAGMYETYTNVTVEGPKIFTCGDCQDPCKTCGDNKTDCLSCDDGYLWYDIEHTCYKEFTWYFPFVTMCILLIVFVWIADCFSRETNIFHSVLYFLSLLEDVTILYYIYMLILG